MVLGTIGRDINITHLGIESPEQEDNRFELEREVSPRHIQRMLGAALDYIGQMQKNWVLNENGPRGLAALYLMAPEKVKQAKTPEMWQKMNDFLNELIITPKFPPAQAEACTKWVRLYGEMKMLFPEKRGELREEESFFIWIKHLLEKYFTESSIIHWSSLAKDFKLAFPERTDILDLDSGKSFKFDDMQRRLVDGSKTGTDHTPWFAQRAAEARILFPDRFSELNIDNDTWNFIRAEYRRANNQRHPMDSITRAETFAAMQVLAAESIEIDDSGLHLNMFPRRKMNNSTPMPEERNF
jgi:hypothetical protein